MAQTRVPPALPADKIKLPMAAGQAPSDTGTKAGFINYPEPQLGYAPLLPTTCASKTTNILPDPKYPTRMTGARTRP